MKSKVPAFQVSGNRHETPGKFLFNPAQLCASPALLAPRNYHYGSGDESAREVAPTP